MTCWTISSGRDSRTGVLRWLSASAIAVLLVLPGCGSAPTQDEASADTTGVEEVEGATEGTSSAPVDETGRINLEQQRSSILRESYVTNARRYMSDGDLSKAEQEIIRAQQVAANDPEVTELYNEIRRAMGDRSGEVQSLAQTMDDRIKVSIEQQQIEAGRRSEAGTAFVRDGNYDDAITEYEAVLRIIQFNPYKNVSFGSMQADTEAALAEAQNLQRTATEEARRSRAEAIYNELKNQELLENLRREKRIERLFSEAWNRFSRGEYSQAEHMANAILAIDPLHEEALDLLETSRDARHQQVAEDTLVNKREQYRRWIEDVRSSQIPYSDILVWPSQTYWDNVVRLRLEDTRSAQDSEDARKVVRLKNQLKNSRTSLEFEDAALPDVIKFLRSVSGINILIDPEILGDLEAIIVPGQINLQNITVESALNILLTYASDADVAFREGVVLITSKEKAFGKASARLHDIRDITIGLTKFESPAINLNLSGGGGLDEAPPLWGKIEETEPELTPEDIIDLIRANIAADTWDANPGTIDVSGGRLLVVHTPEVQEEVGQFLNDLKKFMGIIVTIETRFLTMEEGFLQDIGVEFRGLGGQPGTGDLALLDDVTNGFEDNASRGRDNNGTGLPTAAAGNPSAGIFFNDGSDGDARARTENILDKAVGTLLSASGGLSLEWAFLDDTQVNTVIRAVEKSNRASVLTAPKLTAYNTQKSSIHLINQISYIQDFEVEVAQTAFIADPVIGLIQDGIVFDVRPTVSNDRQYVTLELQPTVATLLQPIPTFTTFLAGLTTPVTLQLPELTVSRAATTVKVPDGGSVIIGGLKNVVKQDSKAETPFFADLPLVGFLFSRKANAEEIQDLIIIATVQITDLREQTENLGR